MRILRVRRGFTTNSSGSNDFVFAPPPPAAATKDGGFGGNNYFSPAPGPLGARPTKASPDAGVSQAQAASRSAPQSAGGSARTDAPVATVVQPEDLGAAPSASDSGAATVAQPAGAPATHPPAPGGGVSLTLVILGVGAVFAAERLIRRIWRRARDGSASKGTGGDAGG